MTLTRCPRDANHDAISPVYLPTPVSSGAKFRPMMTMFIATPEPSNVLQSAALVGILSTQDRAEGQKNNLQIHPYRPMFDVVEIVSDAFLRGREARDFAAQIIHLGPAGHTRSDVVAEEVASNGFVIELLSCLHRGNMWPRSDERHFSAEYIDKLRQF